MKYFVTVRYPTGVVNNYKCLGKGHVDYVIYYCKQMGISRYNRGIEI